MPRKAKDPGDKRKAVVQLRVTVAEQLEIKGAAKLDRRTISDWLRVIALDAARAANKDAARRRARP